MNGLHFAVAIAVLIGLTTAAQAEERDLCVDRPGKATPACTVEAGRLQIEAGLIDYSRSRDAETIEDDTRTGDLLLVYGVNDSLDARIG